MSADCTELDELINAEEVAAILGLAHRNSVSTYRARYDDFPLGEPAPGAGRGRLWVRGEIVAWHHRFRSRHAQAGDQPSERTDALVDATVRLMLANPCRDISIREIATEAGVAHSDLYRHAESKEHLLDLALKQVVASVEATIPNTLDEFRDSLPAIVIAVRETRSAMLVLLNQADQGAGQTAGQDLAVQAIARILAEHRAERGITSTVDAQVVAAAVGGLVFGLTALEPRWLAALDLDEIPADQVATLIRAMLDA